MIIKDKNKSKLKIRNKILVLGFITIILVGLFGIVSSVRAQTDTDKGTCYWNPIDGTSPVSYSNKKEASTRGECQNLITASGKNGFFGTTTSTQTTTAQCTPTYDVKGNVTNGCITGSLGEKPAEKTDSVGDLFGKCFPTDYVSSFSVGQCLVSWAYWLFLTLPSYILYITAYLFNAMLALTLGTVLYNNNFLPEAWRIIRDFSNIFFIIVLLYISIKMILGLGVAEMKKMIVNVIIAALLINFSMFMTQVVIDSSNVLALIFYNKIQVVPNNMDAKTAAGGAPSDLQQGENYRSVVIGSVNTVQEKDIAGGIVAGFNPAHFINPTLGLKLKDKLEATPGYSTTTKVMIASGAGIAVTPLTGVGGPILAKLVYDAMGPGEGTTLPPAIALAIIFTGCVVYLFAAWAFFVAGLAFIGRLIELWILIIFSPFAFMSFSVPKLKSLDFLGWDAWIKRLVSVSFMAPIFMFFLLLITKLVQINIFENVFDKNASSASIPRMLLIAVIPAIIYVTMLYKATEYAKKHSGEFGEAVIKYGKMAGALVGGIALGAATGGVGMVATATLGRAGAGIASSAGLKAAEAKGGFGGFLAGKLRDVGSFAGKSSFDLRKTPGVSSLIKSAGMKTESSAFSKSMGLSTEGGYEKRKKDYIEKRQERAKGLEVGENEKLKQDVRNAQNDLDEAKSDPLIQTNIRVSTKAVTDAEKALATSERELKDEMDKLRQGIGSNAAVNAARARRDTDVGNLDTEKSTLKHWEGFIKDAEKAVQIAENEVTAENRRRRTGLANADQNSYVAFITSGGIASHKVRRESSNQIRRTTKQETPSK